MYNGTCLIRYTKGPGKCVRLYRMSEYSGFIYLAEILWDHTFFPDVTGCRKTQVSDCTSSTVYIYISNMTSFKRFESKPVVKIIYTYTHCNLWRHRQFITIFYQSLHIRIEIIHGSHMYILFLPRVGLYVSFLPLAYARGKTSWHKALPVVRTIYAYGFHELFLKYIRGKHFMQIRSWTIT
jgi:hypothetical protein